MHCLIFGHSFTELVVLILLPGLALYFLNKKEAGVRGNVEDADTGASGLSTALVETNFGGSRPSLTETNNGACGSSPTESSNDTFSSYLTETNSGASRETNNDVSSLCPVETNSGGSSSSPAETNDGTSSLFPIETNNGASSSLVASTGYCYEVFLSFRGPDTRNGFTDHLYHGLLDAGINVFRDNDELPQGENIKPELLAAITKSKILIPILSKNYGTSNWCLDELVQIMECKNNNRHIVLPIFYKVKPTEVRHQTGSFGDKFLNRERHFDLTILKKWKKALLEVSTLKGYEADGYEAKLVKSIVQEVLSILKKMFELNISKNLVGIDSHVKEVMEFMNNKSHVTLFVGIHGMGGIGKTTLAKFIYNKLSNQFEHRSFIADIRELCKRGIHYLQNQLLKDLLKGVNEVYNEHEGAQLISSKFKGKKVLLLLDDVDNVAQLNCVAGNHDWFSSGSRIIITTRNKRILEEAGVDYDYDHKQMDNKQSLVLFSKHAFRMDSPPREFEDLTQEVVSIARGLPLSLEVFGSLLWGKGSIQWKYTIKKLKKVPPMDVQEKLKISYEALDYEQKQIFLDIACFFIGTDKRIASYMWEACNFFPGEGIEVLRSMSLIKVGDNHELRMHDQLRDLGREIVRKENQQQPQYRSRLWDSKEALKVLKDNKGTDKTEGIDLSGGSSEGFDLSGGSSEGFDLSGGSSEGFDLRGGSSEGFNKIAKQDGNNSTVEQFKKLTRLRFLYMKGPHLRGDFEDSMEELRWLRWPYCPMNFEINNFFVKEFGVLELPYSKINEKWGGWSFFKMANELKYLDLSYCVSLKDTDFLSAFKTLEVLILNWCWRLKQIDASIGDIETLLRLELCGCKSLTELPARIGKLKALQQLDLQGTRSLSTLPDSIRSLKNLEILEISDSGIEELPNGIGSLTNLQELRAFNCSNLKGEMVESMCNLSSLQRLDFLGCDKLQSLPHLPSGLTYLGVTCQSHNLPSLSHLAHLKELRVSNCGFLGCIQVLPSMLLRNSEPSQPTDVEESESPQSLNMLFQLEFLQVGGCGFIKILDVSQSVHLRTLSIQECENLLEVQGLDKLKYLESLTVRSCDSIKRLDLPKLNGLKKLDASYCKKLAEIQGLDRLEYLESLDIEGCISIERIDPPKSKRLKELKAGGDKKLAEIEGLDKVEYLERLDIEGWASIRRLDLRKFRRLKELKTGGCKNLVEIQGLDRLEFLESLDISYTSIGRLLLPKSKSLKELEAECCKNLAEIQGLDRSDFLERLHIERCTSMEKLDLQKSERLKDLKAGGCKKLAKIQGLDRLECLERLDISNCTSIGRLDLPNFGSLKILYAKSCKKLAKIQGLERLEFLERLDISGCSSIERLLLPKFKSLKMLEVKECKKLVEIQSLNKLEFLRELNTIGCKSLKKISELSENEIYQYYEVENSKTIEFGLDYMDDSDESI